MSEQEQTAARNLLAVLHRDGGQHTEAVGFVQSCLDAEQAYYALRAEIERLTSETATRLEAMKDCDKTIVALGAKLDFWRERAQRAEAQLAALLSKGWLVWSNEHSAWWNPERLGYTQRMELAGRYSLKEAEACAEMRSRDVVPPEVIVPSPELREALAAGAEEGK